jgi:hypothetical protein
VVRGISVTKRDEVVRDWRKLHNENLQNLYCSPSIIRITKSRRMICARYVACTGKHQRKIDRYGGKDESWRIISKIIKQR